MESNPLVEISVLSNLNRIKERIGYYGEDVLDTITYELKMLRAAVRTPYVEMNIDIVGDNFTVSKTPILVGESHIVNGHAIITLEDLGTGKILIVEWRDVSFSGKIGELVGAGGAYDGKKVSVTYFYNDEIKYYTLAIDNEELSSISIMDSVSPIIVLDRYDNSRHKAFFTNNGALFFMEVPSSTPINDLLVDTSTSTEYQLFLEKGIFNYEET